MCLSTLSSASTLRVGKEFSPVTGFFIDAGPSEVVVRKWNQQEERLAKVSEEEVERYSQAVRNMEFDRYLGPYNLNQYGDWKRLSNYIAKDTIERLEPIGGDITVACESDLIKSTQKMPMEKALDEQLSTSKFSTPVDRTPCRGCYYTSIPRMVKRTGIEGRELTSLNLDKTQLLETILVKDYGGSEDLLLGELQFAFVAFMIGHSLEAFLQWKSLVALFLGCIEAPFRTRSQLFTKFIKVIYYQLKYGFRKESSNSASNEHGSPALLDDTWFSTDSFLYRLCKDYFSLILGASVVDGELLAWTRKFKDLLHNTLGWNFPQKSGVEGICFEEDDEYAPTVEMMDD
ncbi:protein AAR2 homolog isoform X2 [Punica granatum]|uniref:Protein AAR2 homolog isoform X2 n=1 Tax=Punica granatum TaxID=22663 RepID=A0A6P8DVL5_PUNGR|nr:protein AAR2 homolog isoform X2 [Punica granatum]